jgi:hypothetical protein
MYTLDIICRVYIYVNNVHVRIISFYTLMINSYLPIESNITEFLESIIPRINYTVSIKIHPREVRSTSIVNLYLGVNIHMKVTHILRCKKKYKKGKYPLFTPKVHHIFYELPLLFYINIVILQVNLMPRLNQHPLLRIFQIDWRIH